MFHLFIHFSTVLSTPLAAGLLQEEHPPAEMANPFHFGLSPFGVIVVVLLVIAVVWTAMNSEANRADLHAVAHHNGDAHGHDAPAH